MAPLADRRVGPGEARALEAALKVLESQGARIVEVRMPDVSDVPRFWSVICGHEVAGAHAATFPARAAEYGPYLRALLADGAAVTPEQLAAAWTRRAALTAQMNALLATVEVLARPASDSPAWSITHALQVGSRDDALEWAGDDIAQIHTSGQRSARPARDVGDCRPWRRLGGRQAHAILPIG